VLSYFSGPSGSSSPALLRVENRVPLKPVIGVVRDVAFFHYPSCTDSIKPSLQFSCNFGVFNATRGSLLSDIYLVYLVWKNNYLFVYILLSLQHMIAHKVQLSAVVKLNI
jgi:hypothetical protein